MRKFALTAAFLLLATGHAYALGDDGDGGSNRGDVSNGSVGKSGKGGKGSGGFTGGLVPLDDGWKAMWQNVPKMGRVTPREQGSATKDATKSGGVGDKTGHSAQQTDKATW